MKRRQVLLLGAAGTGGLALTAFGLWPGNAWRRTFGSGLGRDADALVIAAEGAGATGEQLTQLGDEREALAAALVARLLPAGANPSDPAELSRRISAAVADDFANGRVIAHEGWVLSDTEARLARLRFLAFGKRTPSGDEDAETPAFLAVLDWGPRETVTGLPFNVQSDGHYGLWFKVPDAPPWLVVRIDGEDAPTFVQSGVVTSGLHGSTRKLIERAGGHRIEFFDPPTGRVQVVGEFLVRQRPAPFVAADGTESKIFCALEGWGPQQARAGVPENVQPDGSMGLWVRTSCVPPDSYLQLGDVRLATTVQSDVVTARVPLAMLEVPGSYPLALVHMGSRERMPVGELVIVAGTTGQ